MGKASVATATWVMIMCPNKQPFLCFCFTFHTLKVLAPT